MKIEVIQEFLGVEVGTVRELPADIARDLINKGLAKVFEASIDLEQTTQDDSSIDDENLINVKVTEETLDLNPELAEEGVEVGDTIQVDPLTVEELVQIENGEPVTETKEEKKASTRKTKEQK